MQFPFEFFEFFDMIFIIFPIFIFVMFIIIFATACRMATKIASNVSKGISIEAPSFAIPTGQRGQTRSDSSEIRTVRLPEVCPTCGAALSHEAIDWVGPLESKCNYCGGTVLATFENI